MHTYNPTLLRSMHIPQHELLAADGAPSYLKIIDAVDLL